jgi:hypothetical protein
MRKPCPASHSLTALTSAGVRPKRVEFRRREPSMVARRRSVLEVRQQLLQGWTITQQEGYPKIEQ